MKIEGKYERLLCAVLALGLAAAFSACGHVGSAQTGEPDPSAMTSAPQGTKEETPVETRRITMKTADGKALVFHLNDSPAADSLYAQLPLTVELQNYSDNEKIFYPPEKLDVGDSIKTSTGKAGTLAYYAPWGDVVFFYGPYRPGGDLYELGTFDEAMVREVEKLQPGPVVLEK